MYSTRIVTLVFLLLNFTFFLLQSQEISPHLKIKTSGAITDFVIVGSEVILTTDAGTVEKYQISNGKSVGSFSLPPMKDFMGEPVPTKVYSIDILNDQLLIIAQGNHGFRNVLIGNMNKLDTILSAVHHKMMVKKARFTNQNQILIGLMSNELILFDLTKKSTIYNLYISPYTFSDFSLSKDKQFAFTSDESGIVHKIDVNKGESVADYSKNNVDNIYQLVYKSGTIITAGQDRRVGIYQTQKGQQYYLQKDFLVYSIGLSQEGTIGAFCASEENDIVVFNTLSKADIALLNGHKSTVTKIDFLDDNTIISSSDDHYLIIWKIDQ